MEYIGAIAFLWICSIGDLRNRQISVRLCMITGVLGVVMQWVMGTHKPGDLILGVAVGIGFLVLAFLTREKIGFGDGMVLIVLGILVGGFQSLNILLWGLILCTLWGILMIVFFKVERGSTVPFVPFLAIASVVQFSLQ